MIKGIGNDIIEVSRIRKVIERYHKRFLDRVFTKEEQSYCLKQREAARHFAGRFAAKEAIVKALGTGIGKKIGWLDIAIINDTAGKPLPRFSSKMENPHILLTISHCKEYATAVAVWVA